MNTGWPAVGENGRAKPRTWWTSSARIRGERMFVVIPEGLVQTWLAAAPPTGPVFGQWLDERDCLRLAAASSETTPQVGIWVSQAEWDTSASAVRLRLGQQPLLLVCDTTTGRVTCFTSETGTWRQVPSDVVHLEADYHKRQQGLFDVGYLRDRTVAVIGLGTGGGQIAAQLARCGVGHFRLVDFDRLEVHNIARHVCTLDDLGRRKTAAMADLLRRIHPAVEVQT